MAYTVVFTKQAAKALLKIPAGIAANIRLKIDQIAEVSFLSHPNVTKLQNREGYRLRVGDWRIIYDIQQEKVLVIVVKIGLWKEVYR